MNPCGHVSHDIAESAHVVLVQRCIDLIQQAERRWVEIEYGKYERHGGQSLLAARQQVNGAVLLSWRPGHDGHACRQDVVADELEVGVPTAEQPGKLLLEAGVDALVGLLEPVARLLVDPPHGLIEGVQCRGQIGKLAIQVVLTLSLLLQLVDGGQVDLPQLLEVRAHRNE